jgi:hypothetical protein
MGLAVIDELLDMNDAARADLQRTGIRRDLQNLEAFGNSDEIRMYAASLIDRIDD